MSESDKETIEEPEKGDNDDGELMEEAEKEMYFAQRKAQLDRERAELMARFKVMEEKTAFTNDRREKKEKRKAEQRIINSIYREDQFLGASIENRREEEYIMLRQNILIPDVLTARSNSVHRRKTGTDYHITISGYEGSNLVFNLDVEGASGNSGFSGKFLLGPLEQYFADGMSNAVSFQTISRLHPHVNRCIIHITHQDPVWGHDSRFPGHYFSGKGIYAISQGENYDPLDSVPISDPSGVVIDSGDVARYGYNANVIVVGIMEKKHGDWYYSAADIGFFIKGFYVGDVARLRRYDAIDKLAENHLSNFFCGDLKSHFNVIKYLSEKFIPEPLRLRDYLGITYDGERNKTEFAILKEVEQEYAEKTNEKSGNFIDPHDPGQSASVPPHTVPVKNKSKTKLEKKKKRKPEPKKIMKKVFGQKKKAKKSNTCVDSSDDLELNLDDLNLDDLNLDDMNFDDLNLEGFNPDDIDLDFLNLEDFD